MESYGRHIMVYEYYIHVNVYIPFVMVNFMCQLVPWNVIKHYSECFCESVLDESYI